MSNAYHAVKSVKLRFNVKFVLLYNVYYELHISMSKVTTATAPSELSSESELDWIQMRKDFAGIHAETTKEKMARKVKENPLVPIGCAATLTALGFGLWNFRQGRSQMSQYMMRARILAQGFTVIALIIGVGMTYANKEPPRK